MSKLPESDHEEKHRPQGALTGRWEIVSNAGKPQEQRQWKRWSDVPLWYRVLDRFGLPTLFALLLMYGIYRILIYTLGVMDRQATTFTNTMAAQVQATEKLTDQVEGMSDAMQTMLEHNGIVPPRRRATASQRAKTAAGKP